MTKISLFFLSSYAAITFIIEAVEAMFKIEFDPTSFESKEEL
jgi:hypothetical protein